MKKKLIYSALVRGSVHPFDELGEKSALVQHSDELKELDSMLVVWGGADINPAYYKHEMHSTTYPGGLRDRLEWELMVRAKEIGIPIIGVCRGAQMACALSGGFLLQDVHNHMGNHLVATLDHQVFNVNSIHHQMMNMTELNEEDYELVAWREGRKGAPYGWRPKDSKTDLVWIPPTDWREPEFVYFKKTRAYAIQWHPEGMSKESPATQYILNYIQKKEEEHGNSYSARTISCDC